MNTDVQHLSKLLFQDAAACLLVNVSIHTSSQAAITFIFLTNQKD